MSFCDVRLPSYVRPLSVVNVVKKSHCDADVLITLAAFPLSSLTFKNWQEHGRKTWMYDGGITHCLLLQFSYHILAAFSLVFYNSFHAQLMPLSHRGVLGLSMYGVSWYMALIYLTSPISLLTPKIVSSPRMARSIWGLQNKINRSINIRYYFLVPKWTGLTIFTTPPWYQIEPSL